MPRHWRPIKAYLAIQTRYSSSEIQYHCSGILEAGVVLELDGCRLGGEGVFLKGAVGVSACGKRALDDNAIADFEVGRAFANGFYNASEGPAEDCGVVLGEDRVSSIEDRLTVVSNSIGFEID